MIGITSIDRLKVGDTLYWHDVERDKIHPAVIVRINRVLSGANYVLVETKMSGGRTVQMSFVLSAQETQQPHWYLTKDLAQQGAERKQKMGAQSVWFVMRIVDDHAFEPLVAYSDKALADEEVLRRNLISTKKHYAQEVGLDIEKRRTFLVEIRIGTWECEVSIVMNPANQGFEYDDRIARIIVEAESSYHAAYTAKEILIDNINNGWSWSETWK